MTLFALSVFVNQMFDFFHFLYLFYRFYEINNGKFTIIIIYLLFFFDFDNKYKIDLNNLWEHLY